MNLNLPRRPLSPSLARLSRPQTRLVANDSLSQSPPLLVLRFVHRAHAERGSGDDENANEIRRARHSDAPFRASLDVVRSSRLDDARMSHAARVPRSVAHRERAPSTNDRRLKLLCLHSFRTSGDILRAQMTLAGWRETYEETCEFITVDAPNRASGPVHEDVSAFFGESTERFEWWNATRVDGTATTSYAGLEKSLRAIEATCERDGPFDGVLGFSQGATLAAIALATPRTRGRFGFGIFVSGMKSRAAETETLAYDAVTVPTLHVIGRKDQVMPVGMSEGLFEAMMSSARTRATHGGGHVVPRRNDDGEPVLREFLAAQRRRIASSL